MVSVDCSDTNKFVENTDAEIYAIADELAHLYTSGQKDKYEKKSKYNGLKYLPNGVLFVPLLREFFSPTNHQIADWMHMLCNGGVVGTELGLLIHVLKAQRPSITLEELTNFLLQFTLPKKHGKVDAKWLGSNRLHDDNLQTLCGMLMSLCPIVLLFLEVNVAPKGILQENILCFKILVDILGLLSLGPDRAMRYVDKLRKLIVLHARMFSMLYPLAAKPKFHHFLCSTVRDMEWVGKLLSCFVTERLHRTSRKAALHVFRHMEHTVIADVINRQCNGMMNDVNLYNVRFTVNPKDIQLSCPGTFSFALSCVLECGEIFKDDIVWMRDGTVGAVVKFWEKATEEDIMVEIANHPIASPTSMNEFRQDNSVHSFHRAQDLFDACSWFTISPGLIKVIQPFAARADL